VWKSTTIGEDGKEESVVELVASARSPSSSAIYLWCFAVDLAQHSEHTGPWIGRIAPSNPAPGITASLWDARSMLAASITIMGGIMIFFLFPTIVWNCSSSCISRSSLPPPVPLETEFITMVWLIPHRVHKSRNSHPAPPFPHKRATASFSYGADAEMRPSLFIGSSIPSWTEMLSTCIRVSLIIVCVNIVVACSVGIFIANYQCIT
jgi:hypothetical protein